MLVLSNTRTPGHVKWGAISHSASGPRYSRAGGGRMTLTDQGLIDWVAGLFPVVPARGKPVTLMFTDIQGFTTHAAARGDHAAVRLLRAHDAAVLPAVRRYMGRILKRLGDGVMVVFPHPA